MKYVKASRYQLVLFTLLVVGQMLIASRSVSAKPALGKKWSSEDLVSMAKIDHSAFSQLLQKYVDSDGYVDYKSWRASKIDRNALRSYLAHLSQADPNRRTNKNALIAFWINAYNAVTLEGILQVYPTTSIRNHTAKVFGFNIWKDLPLLVGNRQYSLNDIEHEILRKQGEPRVHFAIVCASISCPRLLNSAYQAKTLDEQLTLNAKDFFSRSGNFRADSRQRTIYLSSILDWFSSDFGRSQSAKLKYLAPYLPKSAQTLAANPQTRVKYLEYNWNLNDQSRKR